MNPAFTHRPQRSLLIMAARIALTLSVLLFAHGSGLPALESFFAEDTRFAERLSPDGKQVAYLGPDDQKINCLWVIGTRPADTPVRISISDGSAVSAFFWIGKDNLFWQSMHAEGRPRFYLGDARGAKVQEILADEKRVIALHGVINSDHPAILVGLSEGPAAFQDLYRVKLRGDNTPERVCANDHKILSWAWNQAGTPVAGLRWTESGAKEILNLRDGEGAVIFRAGPDDDARLLRATDDGASLIILTNRNGDLTHLEYLDLNTGKSEKIATDPLCKVDLDDMVTDPESGKILATGYNGAVTLWQSADPAFLEMLKAVAGLPDSLNMTCLGVNENRQRFLIKRFSDRDPGTVYLYDVSTHELRMLWQERPETDRSTLCETKACDYPARDGTLIPAYLTLPNDGKSPWPLVVFPHGGPYTRTRPGFDGRVQFLASRGYAVLQPNFRGSRGYGKAFMNAGDGQWGRGIMQTDVTDGVDHLIREGLVDARRIAILGGSYGGYAALAGLCFTPDRYAAGICLFGISDLVEYTSHHPAEWQAYSGDTIRRVGNPDTPEGMAFLAARSPVNHVESFNAPLLIYHGLKDHLIPPLHANTIVTKLRNLDKPVTYLAAPDEGHGFADPNTEMAVYRAIEIFLHEHLGGKVGPAPETAVTHKLAILQQRGKAEVEP